MYKLALIILIASATIGGILFIKGHRSEADVGTAASQSSLLDSDPTKMAAGDRVARAVVHTDDFIQEVFWLPGKKWIRVINRERTPQGTWEKVHYDFDTAYDVYAVAGRQANELYIAGRGRSFETILERWVLDPHPGGRFFHIEPAPQAIGTPATPIPGASGGVTGGTPTPIEARLLIPRQERVELYRGDAFGPDCVWDISPDPQGRFLLVLGATPKALYRVPLHGSVMPTLLYGTSDWSMIEIARSMHCKHHYMEGRVHILRGQNNQGKIFSGMLFDADNDGIFESKKALSNIQYATEGYTGQVWLSDFTTYTTQ